MRHASVKNYDQALYNTCPGPSVTHVPSIRGGSDSSTSGSNRNHLGPEPPNLRICYRNKSVERSGRYDYLFPQHLTTIEADVSRIASRPSQYV